MDEGEEREKGKEKKDMGDVSFLINNLHLPKHAPASLQPCQTTNKQHKQGTVPSFLPLIQ